MATATGMRRGGERYRNPCLTMHQPWASLLVHGIKRIEGRSWPSPITGRLWIHAASKVPDPATIAAMEDFYTQIYATNGIAAIKFPDHYPVSRLLGCVEVVGCIRSQELACWEHVPQSVRLEALTDFCWLCENPQKLVVPFEMRGYQGVYNLERRIYEAAVRGLLPVEGPLPVKFPLPDPRDPFSLRPGSLNFDSSKSALEQTPSISAAIAGAQAAATQYSRKDHNAATGSSRTRDSSKGIHVHGSSGSGGSLPSSNQNHSSHLQDQNHLQSHVQNSPSCLQNQDHLPSIMQNRQPLPQNQHLSFIVDSSSSYLQNQNAPAIVQLSPFYMQHQNPQPIVQNTPSHVQYQNTEPRRSPRVQNGSPSRLAAVALRELKQSNASKSGEQSVPITRRR